MRMLAAALLVFAPLRLPSQTAGTPSPQPGGPDNYLETVKVSDNVYVFKPKIDWMHGNGVAIIGPDGVFFIDTYHQFNYAQEAIRRLRRITRLPVRYVLNTHWHNDHVMGNAVFKREFPESRIIAHDSAAPYFERVIKRQVADEEASIRDNIAGLDSDVMSGKTSGGLPLSGPLMQFWKWQLREAKEYQRQYQPEKYVPIDITFSDTLTMRWGGQTLRLIHMAQKGHSASDVVVWIPETRMLIAGDLVVGPTPYATYFNSPGMIKAIQALIAMNPSIIVPGHGEVEYDLSYMKLLEQAFTAYRSAAEQAVAGKVPLATAVDSIVFPDIDKRFTDDDPVRQWAYRAFFSRNLIYNTYKSLGALPPPKP